MRKKRKIFLILFQVRHVKYKIVSVTLKWPHHTLHIERLEKKHLFHEGFQVRQLGDICVSGTSYGYIISNRSMSTLIPLRICCRINELIDEATGRSPIKVMNKISLQEATQICGDDKQILSTARKATGIITTGSEPVIYLCESFWTLKDGMIPVTHLLNLDDYDVSKLILGLIYVMAERNNGTVIIDGEAITVSNHIPVLHDGCVYVGPKKIWPLS